LWSIWSWVTELLAFGVMPLVILILNILVMLETRRMTARFNELSSTSGGNSSATTVTLLAVSFYLIFSTLPVTVCYALALNFPAGVWCVTDEGIYTHAEMQNYFSYWYWRILIQELGMSHYACNILIYLLTGQQFRRELLDLVRRIGFCRTTQNSASRDEYSREERILLTTTVISTANGKNGMAMETKNNGNGKASEIKRT